jgi:hypothetical protein
LRYRRSRLRAAGLASSTGFARRTRAVTIAACTEQRDFLTVGDDGSIIENLTADRTLRHWGGSKRSIKRHIGDAIGALLRFAPGRNAVPAVNAAFKPGIPQHRFPERTLTR